MYLKVERESKIYLRVKIRLKIEELRFSRYLKWQVTNLPLFSDILMIRVPYYLYPVIVGWKFVEEVDKKTWRRIRMHPNHYEPNFVTREGRMMGETLTDKEGIPFDCREFYRLFRTNIKSSVLPMGFLYNDVVYMFFDDLHREDFKEFLSGQYTEIDNEEWKQAIEAYANEYCNGLQRR